MIGIGALRGYVLEELLAKLFLRSGYDLLVDATQDNFMLSNGASGLEIHGRGANHQADVLGELRARPPFTYPLRVFVEAKYRRKPVGLEVVRNAVGVINDVNEFYTGSNAKSGVQRHDYRYTLFSTSGYTGDAERYALAQRISLVDLRDPAFRSLIRLVDRIANRLLALAKAQGLNTFPVNQMREAFRKAFGTWTMDARPEPQKFDEAEDRAANLRTSAELPPMELAKIASEVSEFGDELFFIFNDTPFVFVGRSDDLVEDPSDTTGRRTPRLEPGVRAQARIAFGGETIEAGEWTLETTGMFAGTQIRLANSPAIGSLLVGNSDRVRSRRLRNTVAIAVEDDLVNVEFQPVAPREGQPEQELRREHVDTSLAYRGDREDRPEVSEEVTELWTLEAVHHLLSRLPEHYVAVITYAARNGGYIDRERVYEICGFPSTRMLRGFTRPPRRIAMDLINEGLLHPETEWPLYSMYDKGVRVTRFGVPDEFRWLLA